MAARLTLLQPNLAAWPTLLELEDDRAAARRPRGRRSRAATSAKKRGAKFVAAERPTLPRGVGGRMRLRLPAPTRRGGGGRVAARCSPPVPLGPHRSTARAASPEQSPLDRPTAQRRRHSGRPAARRRHHSGRPASRPLDLTAAVTRELPWIPW
ncbi:Os12g0220833 [Oryza sativa Japonica Group]|uniref:Os12g0220833 protein n=1 Tax=Oryza sativa subsp. japonica TaxID=39947 RepID=A0A0N7KTR7_ORYSJ|nr:Os12g0220833 [Oryza sativa Japonica Group]